MFNAKASVVKSWMVVGKLLILLAGNAYADNIGNPRFFEYQASNIANRLLELSFGWYKTLDLDQKAAYYQSITHALMYAENGEAVSWYERDASGLSVPVITWPTGSGYCRRLHIKAIAYNTEKNITRTACFENASSKWQWLRE